MGNTNVTVPYDDFVEMVSAKSKLDALKLMVESGKEYCSPTIMVLLGVKENTVCTDMCATSADATATPENS
ncbi:MAG: hypothetical protein ACI4AB_10580 [Acetatifactor sp.]